MKKVINNIKRYEIIYSIQFKDEKGNYGGAKKYIKYFGSDIKNSYVKFVADLFSNIDYEVEHLEVIYSNEDLKTKREIKEACK